MGWKEKLSEFLKTDADEFLVAVALIALASVALFSLDKVGFLEWAGACATFVTIWSTNRTVREVKAVNVKPLGQ